MYSAIENNALPPLAGSPLLYTHKVKSTIPHPTRTAGWALISLT